MSYEVLGKIFVTGLILLLIPVTLFIIWAIFDILGDYIRSLPDWIQETMGWVFTSAVLFFVSYGIYVRL